MTSTLRIESWSMPAACLGPVSPLPALGRISSPFPVDDLDPTIPRADRQSIGHGVGAPIDPYPIQDGYDRDRRPRDFRVAVLENRILRAVFLLDYGGRLWSLFDKSAERELLYVNPVFQPANLAIRNAWFSGGVEWNMSVVGHSPFTCEPLFAGRVQGDDGVPVLRLYEWERVRGLIFQLDAYLPREAPFLFVRIRLINANCWPIPTYWWSNIAVPESSGHRVLVPADWAMSFFYRGRLRRVPVPFVDGVDLSYPTNSKWSSDFFFRLADGQRPWIASLNASGHGLIQTSTARLRGRKLFVWGMGPGGRRWQQFLSEPGRPYAEIQAGLGRTQAECLPMPAGAEWSWLEAYGPMEADAARVHGSDWAAAVRSVEQRLEQRLPQDDMEAEFSRGATTADRPPHQILHRGSGWGALENLRRSQCGDPPLAGPALTFDQASLGPEQEPWLAMLEHGELPYEPPDRVPCSWMVQRPWHQILEQAIAQGRADHYLGWLHLGVMRYAHNEFEAASEAWDRSLACEPSAWAYRNLAVFHRDRGRLQVAADRWLDAWRLRPQQPQLAIECCLAQLAVARPSQVLALVCQLPDPLRRLGRLRILEACALLELGDLDAVERILESDLEIVDLRESEVSITDLWFTFHEKRLARNLGIPIDPSLKQRVRREHPPPARFDFRMQRSDA